MSNMLFSVVFWSSVAADIKHTNLNHLQYFSVPCGNQNYFELIMYLGRTVFSVNFLFA
jgi:hypothetical protein